MSESRTRIDFSLPMLLVGGLLALVVLGSVSPIASEAFAGEIPDKIHLTWRKVSPAGGEEVNLVLGTEPGGAQLSRNSNFDLLHSDNVRIGLFSTDSDPVLKAETPFIRAALRKLSKSNPKMEALKRKLPQSLGAPHAPVFLLNGTPVPDGTPAAQELFQAFQAIVRNATWRPIDAVEVAARPRESVKNARAGLKASARFLGKTSNSQSKAQASVECPFQGETLSGEIEWRCLIENYGSVYFYAPKVGDQTRSSQKGRTHLPQKRGVK